MANAEYIFPLVLWEQTPDYQQQLNAATDRFSAILKTPPAYIEVTFTSNGIPVIWKNRHNPPYRTNSLSAKDALVSAKKNGTTGYFTAEEMGDFKRGEGIITEMEMDDLGFRRSKNDSSKWARKKRGEPVEQEAHHRHWQELYGTDYDVLGQEERDRLQELMVDQNVPMRVGNTYSVSTAKTGLIFVTLDVNPFTQRPGDLGRQLLQRAHINRDQKGFTIEARNVKLTDDSSEEHDAVHIKALIPDKGVEEVVWPATTHAQTIIDMASDLRKRATRR